MEPLPNRRGNTALDTAFTLRPLLQWSPFRIEGETTRPQVVTRYAPVLQWSPFRIEGETIERSFGGGFERVLQWSPFRIEGETLRPPSRGSVGGRFNGAPSE